MNQYGKITYTGSYLPERNVTNEELSQFMDTSDEWISSRTGIRSRHVVTSENTSDLCIKAAQVLLDKSQIDPETIDFIIVATITPDYQMPSVACQVQAGIKAVNAFAFDISAACSGFIYSLSIGEKMIRGGYKRGIILGGETLSKALNWEDRTSAVLFGDGAAGVILEAVEKPHLLAEKLQSDGQRGSALTSGFQFNESPFYQSEGNKREQSSSFLKMNGREIFDFTMNDVSKNIQSLVDEHDFEADYFLLHQANIRIIDKLAKKLKIPREKFLSNMDKYGNTSAASIPILLDEAVNKGIIKLDSTQQVVLTGFGGGLTWGTMLLTL
ncbi:beta-ketoacyl-ACP synthase III [Enterococcus sp. CWB-B31]|uniref:beta-ketoacyl-ACP synthase III n=1 Tax=Enterococcus sp. CWB-B31 TaxID=2885159 RepID=UPI001E5DC69B|nr:beta-ketoacyl-ACP synthase III [Enterococcus sp. CWB-B31]MCB5956005.1 ketoacyl-ACP synthase III [Enterococcus sp. CWB-B31]